MTEQTHYFTWVDTSTGKPCGHTHANIQSVLSCMARHCPTSVQRVVLRMQPQPLSAMESSQLVYQISRHRSPNVNPH